MHDHDHREAPGGYPSGKAGDELTVDFTVLGIPFQEPAGGPAFKPNEAVSFMIEMKKIDVARIEAARRGDG